MPSPYLQAPPLFFRPAGLDDLDAIHTLEAAGFPPDEAASRERLEYRLTHASGQFLAAIEPGPDGDVLIGFSCGTLSREPVLTEESMGRHDPAGSLLCLHSVCVKEERRRQGVATRLLRAYAAYVQATTPHAAEVRLICKEALVPLYEGAGFEVVGPSPVVHGTDPWLEMRLGLAEAEGEDEGTGQLQQEGEQGYAHWT